MDIKAVSTDSLHIPGPRDDSGLSAVILKNQSKIEPLGTPDFYARHFDGNENRIPIAYGNGQIKTFDFMKRVDDPSTSLAAAVFINKDDGHAVIFYKGLDLPGRNEGSGRAGFAGDLKAINQARRGEVNDQTAPAEKVYIDTLNDPQIKSVEIVGYSVGSQHLNYMAAKYGARGTAIADMGISDSVLTSVFNKSVANKAPAYTLDQINEQMRDRVIVLDMSKDKLPKWFAAGPSRGTAVNLDDGTWKDWKGLAHIPQVYAVNAETRMIPERPQPVIPLSNPKP